MRYFIKYFRFLFIAFGLNCCTSSKKLIEKQQTEFGSVKFYAVNVSKNNNVDKVYADTDSNGVKRFYSFYLDRIVMTDERAKELSYTIAFHPLPDNFDSNIHHRLSKWDTFVFFKAVQIFKASRYSHLKSPNSSISYEIEVNYLHGFPNNKKFQPL